MESGRPRVLYVSDLAYQARGRRYCDEDIYLTARLRGRFDLAICHPLDARALMHGFDAVVVRNSGPVLHYRDEYDAFRSAATETGVRVFTELTGNGDMAGKQYLLDLYAQGHPVIPTVDRLEDVGRLPDTEDLAFAQRFIDWNSVEHGIQRVDACRARDGALLLVELEDLNPYLSLDRVGPATRDRFVEVLTAALLRLVARP